MLFSQINFSMEWTHSYQHLPAPYLLNFAIQRIRSSSFLKFQLENPQGMLLIDPGLIILKIIWLQGFGIMIGNPQLNHIVGIKRK